MKKYNTNELYVAKLYVVTNEEWFGATLTAKYTGEFLDYAIVKHKEDLVFSSIYEDVLTNRKYRTDVNFNGQVYVESKFLTSLCNYVENEKLTKNALLDVLNNIKISSKNRKQKAAKRRTIIGQIVENLTKELGEEKTYMLLNQIIDELGIEKTQEITNPLSNELGYNVVEKAKNIERTRKK